MKYAFSYAVLLASLLAAMSVQAASSSVNVFQSETQNGNPTNSVDTNQGPVSGSAASNTQGSNAISLSLNPDGDIVISDGFGKLIGLNPTTGATGNVPDNSALVSEASVGDGH